MTFLKFDSALAYIRTKKNGDAFLVSRPIPHYYWKGKPQDKNKFLQIFTDQKLYKRKKGLTALFDPTQQKLCIDLDPQQADLILQFFYNVKKEKLLSPSNGYGFYEVLVCHINGFEYIFLKNRLPKDRINSLKASERKWDENQIRIDKWLDPLRSKEPVPRTSPALS